MSRVMLLDKNIRKMNKWLWVFLLIFAVVFSVESVYADESLEDDFCVSNTTNNEITEDSEYGESDEIKTSEITEEEKTSVESTNGDAVKNDENPNEQSEEVKEGAEEKNADGEVQETQDDTTQDESKRQIEEIKGTEGRAVSKGENQSLENQSEVDLDNSEMTSDDVEYEGEDSICGVEEEIASQNEEKQILRGAVSPRNEALNNTPPRIERNIQDGLLYLVGDTITNEPQGTWIWVDEAVGKKYIIEAETRRVLTGFNNVAIEGSTVTCYSYVETGEIAEDFIGVQKENANDWYFIRSGVVDYTFTGLGKSAEDGKYYYVQNGKYRKGYTGLAKSAFNGWYYYAEDSVCTYTWTGLAKHPEDKKYHFVKNSKLNDEFTGVAKSEYNGEYYFAKDGIVDYTFTGLGKNVDDGKYCYVENGKWKKTANGFHHDGNGKNYAIKNGTWLDGYDGIYLNPVNGKHYYLINGIWATDYNGTVKYVGTNDSIYWCRIRNGIQLDRTTISYFQQNVGKWAHKKYGGKTFADTGCVPTSLAMVISAINNSVVYPDTIGDSYIVLVVP